MAYSLWLNPWPFANHVEKGTLWEDLNIPFFPAVPLPAFSIWATNLIWNLQLSTRIIQQALRFVYSVRLLLYSAELVPGRCLCDMWNEYDVFSMGLYISSQCKALLVNLAA
jgi:hypothetical protein